MSHRYAFIWFQYLAIDLVINNQPELKGVQFVLSGPERGRMVVKAASMEAQANDIQPGMVLADARAIFPDLKVVEDDADYTDHLRMLAEWCIRYTPIVAIYPPDGLTLDITGCAHLWGGEHVYLEEIRSKLKKYHLRTAIADTIGAAWAVAHFGLDSLIVKPGGHRDALLPLPSAALRLEPDIVERIQKLGLYQIRNFINMPRSVLRRRFGQGFLKRLDQALGLAIEHMEPIRPVVPYQERLPCMEPIVTATGIEIALQRLLETICGRLAQEGKGLRTAIFKGYRMDGKVEQIDIVTNRASHHVAHLFKLFELKIATIEPDLGIELFVIEAPDVEDVDAFQETIWHTHGDNDDISLMELLDRITGRSGTNLLLRYMPDEHYWPERSVRPAVALQEKAETIWRTDRPRPMQLLPDPEHIDVTAPVPDYPPMHFRYHGELHIVKKSDGPERIEQEWWLEEGSHRDYFCLEDQNGLRYWVFRLGYYEENKPNWFLHGFFV